METLDTWRFDTFDHVEIEVRTANYRAYLKKSIREIKINGEIINESLFVQAYKYA